MSTVKAAPLNPAWVTDHCAARGAKAGFRLEPFGEAGGVPLLALTKRTPGPRPRVYLSAGIHGDEPAPPLALLALMDAGIFDDRANWFICPLLNPTGFLGQTRENAAGIDLNRDYRSPRSAEIQAHVGWLRRQPNFDLTLCLHEDWEAKGFYLYELNSRRRPTLAEAIVAAVSAVCPIDASELIDGRPARAGILRPDADPSTRELWPEAIYLAAHHSTLGYTLETPSGFPRAQRIAALRTAVAIALDLSLGAQPVPAKGL